MDLARTKNFCENGTTNIDNLRIFWLFKLWNIILLDPNLVHT